VAEPHYTKEDMKKLAEMSEEGSITATYLPELNHDPKRFRELLETYNLHTDIKYLFQLPINQVPLLINQGNAHGILQYRLKLSK